VRADVTDAETLATLGLKNFDGAVVAIGENLEASVLVTIMAKELGIPYVLAKVLTDTQAKVLKKVGADMVVFPEKETGIRIANKLMYGKFFDAITLSRTYSIMEIDAHKDWIGKSLIDLNLRKVHGINVVAIKQKGAIKVNPEPKEVIKEADVLIVLGKSEVLNKLGGTQKQYKDGDKDDNQ
jgi:trk system potassium uptake protein TrkA